ncbi:MAG: FAD-binding protein [Thermoplasmata archaeon]
MELQGGELGGLRILDGSLEREIYSLDQAEVPEELRGIFVTSLPELVVQPRSEEEILRVLRYAYDHDLPVVPRGAASSAYGGAVPARGGIVLDLSLMRTILAFDQDAAVVVVEPGVRWADLDEFLQRNGYALMSHPTSWFSTIAGWLSTGGYGLYSLSSGPFSSQVEWIRVVDFQGVRTIRQDEEEFKHYVHTEGQMGVLSQLALRVRPRPETQQPLLFTLDSARGALELAVEIASRYRPVHITYYDPARLGEFNELQGREVLERAHSILVVMEDEAQAKAVASFASERASRAEHYRASFLWEHRLFPMHVKKLGPGLLGTELLMAPSSIPAYLERAHKLASRFGVSVANEAHFASPEEALLIPSFLTDQRRFDLYLPHLALVMLLTKAGIRLGGKAYGIGLWNRPFLGSMYPRREVAVLRRYKRRVDPKGLLNPGKAFDASSGAFLRPWMISPYLLPPLILRTVGRLLGKSDDRMPEADVPQVLQEDLRSAAECAHCGACITVCPAYLADRTELVTARGKLLAMERMLGGEELAKEEALKLFDCIHCDACTNVCQSGIDLVPMWDRLETLVAERHGKPLDQIEDFAERVEREEEYHELVRKGLAYPLQTPPGGFKRV